MKVFSKQPRDVLDYDVDMSVWFSSVPGDEIQSVELSITSPTEAEPTLTFTPPFHPNLILMGASPVRFKIWLGGGTNQTYYVVTCLVTTEQDRQKEVEFKVKVIDK